MRTLSKEPRSSRKYTWGLKRGARSNGSSNNCCHGESGPETWHHASLDLVHPQYTDYLQCHSVPISRRNQEDKPLPCSIFRTIENSNHVLNSSPNSSASLIKPWISLQIKSWSATSLTHYQATCLLKNDASKLFPRDGCILLRLMRHFLPPYLFPGSFNKSC
jgi:hypothetical protein